MLSNWKLLLAEVCRKHRLTGFEPYYHLPTEMWERMLLRMAQRSRKKQAHKHEEALRRTVRDLLKQACD